MDQREIPNGGSAEVVEVGSRATIADRPRTDQNTELNIVIS